ncbi:hypothetical protein IM753_10805 [Moraxella sp. K127]|uniref:hypothetical protein n=1 Tax=Moraxella sp. K127 TaxID=2780079 RepID=UPI00187FE8AC|nr:hypothetical protein [Moraxella sp. K127]MBE9591446.1 hypothetical protein [Moraxella sp. K127]
MSEKREHNILEAGRRAIHSVGLSFSDEIKAICAPRLEAAFQRMHNGETTAAQEEARMLRFYLNEIRAIKARQRLREAKIERQDDDY